MGRWVCPRWGLDLVRKGKGIKRNKKITEKKGG
jgi:hypothetical protein